MGWQLTIDDQKILFDDLPIVKFQQVAREHSLSWLDLWSVPGTDLDALYDLIVAAAEHAGVTNIPARPVSMRDGVALLAMLDTVADDLPKVYADGFPPSADGQETTLSSGAPADSDGPPT